MERNTNSAKLGAQGVSNCILGRSCALARFDTPNEVAVQIRASAQGGSLWVAAKNDTRNCLGSFAFSTSVEESLVLGTRKLNEAAA